MKILFINLPYYGHVVPTLGLVRELIRQGCEVTYLMPFGWEDRIAVSGAVFSGYPNHRQLSEQMKNAWAAAERIIEQYDLVIYEQFFFLGKHLAEKHHKPVVRVFTAPVTNHRLMGEYLEAKGPLSLFRCRWIAKAFTRDIAGKIPLKTDNWLEEIVENPPERNLVYTLRQYQPYEEDFPEQHYKFLGPSLYERQKQEFDFSKGSRPVIYISLGTVMTGSRRFFRTCLEAFREENVDVILSVGTTFPIRKLRNVPPNVHIYSSVPQVEVLKMADVFVTHGGMNSVSEALAAGVPMALLPLVSDQPVNARQMEKLGVGKVLDYDSLSPEILREAVFSLAADPQIWKNLRTVQNWIADAPGNRGGAEEILRFYRESTQNKMHL